MTPLLVQGTAQRLPLADASVNCIVTSPPYYGLRSYDSLPPEAWPGGAFVAVPGAAALTIPGPEAWKELDACPHVWKPSTTRTAHTTNGTGTSTLHGAHQPWSVALAQTSRIPASGAWCQGCRCWYGTLGSEPTVDLYLWHMLLVLRELSRVLREDGTLWLNLGDSYSASGKSGGGKQGARWIDHGQPHVGPRGGAWHSTEGIPPGNLLGIPWRVALAAQADGWILRRDVVWEKVSPMPESVRGWSFVKHRVIISTYGNKTLQQMPPARRVQEGENTLYEMRAGASKRIPSNACIQGGTKQIPHESKRNSLGEGSRPAAKCEAEAPRIFTDTEGQGKTKNICPNGKGQRDGTEECQEIYPHSAWPLPSGTSKVTPQTLISCNTQGTSLDARSMAADSSTSEAQMLLVPEEMQANNGSCDTTEQGGTSYSSQCSGSVFPLQQQETQQPMDALIDCPGCPECAPYDGYLLRRGSWRHTASHEYIFQLVKQMGYYANSEAVREDNQEGAIASRKTRSNFAWGKHGASHGGSKPNVWANAVVSGRNPRDVIRPAPSAYAGAHFATFPPSLPEQFLRASCPERVCTACGEPWAPVVHSTATVDPSANGSRFDYGKSAHHGHVQAGERFQHTTHGLAPTCPCPEDTPWRPGIVLDPFGGTATVALAARAMGRHSIMIEASPAYLTLARERLSLDALDAWEGKPTPAHEETYTDLPLFS